MFELVALRGTPAAAVAFECGVPIEEVYTVKSRLSKRREPDGRARGLVRHGSGGGPWGQRQAARADQDQCGLWLWKDCGAP